MRAKRLNRAAPFLFSWMGVTAVMISSLLYNIVATPRTGSVIPLIYATSAALLTILYLQLRSVVSILMYFITAFIGRRNFVTRPDSVLVDSLLGILSLCETEPWTRLETKRRLMLALEGIAQCVERDLPRQLRSGDVVTDVWVKTTTGQMAAYFRYLKKWVVTPSLATRHDFMQCIAQCLSHAAAGDWNALPRQDPDKYSQPQFLFQAVTVGRVVVSGVLPILAFWIVQLTPLKIEGIFEDYIKVGVLIWAILSGLSAIDPLLNTKLEALKDITGLLPIAGKKK